MGDEVAIPLRSGQRSYEITETTWFDVWGRNPFEIRAAFLPSRLAWQADYLCRNPFEIRAAFLQTAQGNRKGRARRNPFEIRAAFLHLLDEEMTALNASQSL